MRHATRAPASCPRLSPMLVCAFAMLLAGVSGCGYNLPLLARPASSTSQHPVASTRHTTPERKQQGTHKTPVAKRHRGKAAPATVAASPPPHDDSVRGQLADARERAAALPADPYWPYRAGALCASLDSLDAARASLLQSLARDSRFAPALALFSKINYDSGRFDDAIAVLESARLAAQRNLGDLEPALLAGLALHYDAAGRTADAREVLAAVPPASVGVAAAAASSIALRHGATPADGELAEKAVRESPASAACQNNAGIARLKAGDVQGARKAFERAIALEPRRAGPYYNLAILEKFYALDDTAALRRFVQYSALSKDDPDGLAQVLGQGAAKDLAEGREP